MKKVENTVSVPVRGKRKRLSWTEQGQSSTKSFLKCSQGFRISGEFWNCTSNWLYISKEKIVEKSLRCPATGAPIPAFRQRELGLAVGVDSLKKSYKIGTNYKIITAINTLIIQMALPTYL